ncbi:unnamed protein product [Moneuplotes crassus]|uniref:Uncharacterized protein n=1 Tax=Euplotes crassus TaxID=5936 RepID=A0AAD2D2Q2_EUPCR|nr:unnamed protein product [Moneuplotes crassus]
MASNEPVTMGYEDEEIKESVKQAKKKRNADHHTSHDKKVNNRASRDSHGSHADESKTSDKDLRKHHKGVQRELKHEGYDKFSGTGHGKEMKKGGHGKGGIGDEDYSKIAEHHSATVAADLLEDEVPPAEEAPIQVRETEETQAEAHQMEQKPLVVTDEEFPKLG